jgi:hypothetical protein
LAAWHFIYEKTPQKENCGHNLLTNINHNKIIASNCNYLFVVYARKENVKPSNDFKQKCRIPKHDAKSQGKIGIVNGFYAVQFVQ